MKFRPRWRPASMSVLPDDAMLYKYSGRHQRRDLPADKNCSWLHATGGPLGRRHTPRCLLAISRCRRSSSRSLKRNVGISSMREGVSPTIHAVACATALRDYFLARQRRHKSKQPGCHVAHFPCLEGAANITRQISAGQCDVDAACRRFSSWSAVGLLLADHRAARRRQSIDFIFI